MMGHCLFYKCVFFWWSVSHGERHWDSNKVTASRVPRNLNLIVEKCINHEEMHLRTKSGTRLVYISRTDDMCEPPVELAL
jgi:hypothetical protein